MLRLGSSKKKDKAKPKPKKEKKAPKPKKEKAAKAPKPKKEKKQGVVLQKQKNNIYTVMLILAFAAQLIACLLLYAELQSYGGLGGWTP